MADGREVGGHGGAAPPPLGVIEGFYGRPWSWKAREEAVAWLASRGYGFFVYAPKGDPYLRKRWREPHPEETAGSLARFAGACREAGVRFGVGLSPYEIWLDFGREAREALARKLAFLDDLGVEDLAILFDDMKGDTPGLAGKQVEIVDWIAGRTGADHLLVCPTYYTDDPVLDRVFGERPPEYLERLGEGLDPSVDVFWTGEEVISREISPGHLRRVAERLGRRPFLWDNYPVNDGERMSRFLHVRAFTGRPAANASLVAGHAVNVAIQPLLTRIPLLTLIDAYRLGGEYRYGEALGRAAREVLGEERGRRLQEDLLPLQDIGHERLGDRADELRERWEGDPHPGAREVVAWLDGEYLVSDAVLHEEGTG